MPLVICWSGGSLMTTGGVQLAVTWTTAALLSAGGAHWPVTRTQYDVVELGLTLIDWPVPNGVAVFGGEPMYH